MDTIKRLIYLPTTIWTWLVGNDAIQGMYYVSPNHKILAELKALDEDKTGTYVLNSTIMIDDVLHTLTDKQVCTILTTKSWFGHTAVHTRIYSKESEV